MTHALPAEARFVRRVFVIALVVLVIPSKLIVLAHRPNPGRFAGATIATLLVWWLLYRLCRRTRRQAWFTAISMVALYLAVVTAPIYASGILLVLALVHGFVTRHFPSSAEVSAPEAALDST